MSQELRFTSPADRRVRWIVGAYAITTDRFISTGNVIDIGDGIVPEVRRTPLTQFDIPTNCFPPACRQFTYLADSQDNFAWAVFGDLSFDITDRLEGSVGAALRRGRAREHDRDAGAVPSCRSPTAFPGQVRKHTWDELQPKVTLRYKPADDRTLYVGYSRGFRSGGFNQTGVGAAQHRRHQRPVRQGDGRHLRGGLQGRVLDRRLTTNLSLYYTQAERLVLLRVRRRTPARRTSATSARSTTRAGARAQGRVTDGFDGYLGLGYTDSEIKESDRAASDVGNQAPLVSKYTRQPRPGSIARRWRRSAAPAAFVRTDFQMSSGPTWFYPDNFTERDPVDAAEPARSGSTASAGRSPPGRRT